MADRKTTTIERGLVLGQPLVIRHFLRQSTSDTPPPDELFWGDKRMKLDFARLPARVNRALPPAILTPPCVGDKWNEFVREAISHGLLV